MKLEDLEQLTAEQVAFRKVSNSWYKLDQRPPVFTVRDKATGVRLLVDPRTYNPELHEVLDEPPTAA